MKYKGVSNKSSLNRPFIETIHGFGISKYGFLGLGTQHQRMGTMAIFKQDYITEKSRDKGLSGTSFYIKVGYCW